MGCWNETCGLTNLPIFVGEDVVLMVIAQLDGMPGKCYYSHDDGAPFALPIYGTYDDYGGLEDIKMSEPTKQMLNDTQFYACKKGEYIEVNVDANNFVETLVDDGLYIKFPLLGNTTVRCEYTPLAALIYHKEAFELIANEMRNRIPYNQDKNYGECLRSQLAQKLEKMRKNRAQWRKLMDELKAKKQNDEPLDLHPFANAFVSETAIWDSGAIGYKFAKAYQSTLDKHPELDVNEFLDDMVTCACFITAMDCMRKSWFSTAGRGSQSGEMYLHKILAKWILKKIDQRMQEWDEPAEEHLKESMYFWNED